VVLTRCDLGRECDLQQRVEVDLSTPEEEDQVVGQGVVPAIARPKVSEPQSSPTPRSVPSSGHHTLAGSPPLAAISFSIIGSRMSSIA
jgi:hypothetical protein